MSYAATHTKPGKIALQNLINEWQAVDRELINAIESETDKKLFRKVQDDCISDVDREKRQRLQADKRNDFIHTLSYNRSIGHISRTDSKQLYQGSTYNRKPVEKKVIPELTEAEQIAQDYRAYKANTGITFYEFNVKGSCLTKFDQAPDKTQRLNTGMSKRTKDKVKDKMLAFYRACSGRAGYRSGVVNFTLLTLTFIAPVEDREGVELLNTFFTALRYRYGLFNFLWVAERQSNGRIHFHIVLDMRVPIGYINSLWVKQQTEAGIRNYESELLLMEDQGTTFQNLHTEGKYNIVQDYLNPADITSIKTIDGVSCYLTKYLIKNESTFDCSGWHCSRAVSKLFTHKIVTKKIFDKTGDSSKNRIISNKTGRLYVNETYYGEYCTLNTIYNKSHYRRYLADMEEINKFILKRDNIIDPDLIRECITIDNQAYRAQFLSEINSN